MYSRIQNCNAEVNDWVKEKRFKNYSKNIYYRICWYLNKTKNKNNLIPIIDYSVTRSFILITFPSVT